MSRSAQRERAEHGHGAKARLAHARQPVAEGGSSCAVGPHILGTAQQRAGARLAPRAARPQQERLPAKARVAAPAEVRQASGVVVSTRLPPSVGVSGGLRARLRLQLLCRRQRHLQRAQLCRGDDASGAGGRKQGGRGVERALGVGRSERDGEHGVVQLRSLTARGGRPWSCRASRAG